MYSEEDLLELVVESVTGLRDPELHRYTLEQLGVVRESDITLNHLPSGRPCIRVTFTPTAPHCSHAALIGLCIVYAILNVDSSLAYDVSVSAHSHRDSGQINRKINDKEVVCAAMESPRLKPILLRLHNYST
uniref:MIP18 family protein CG30152 n=1 Tax=Lygus hesperus TaxID=30085 RepID=A0A0A9XQE3_LYGHE